MLRSQETLLLIKVEGKVKSLLAPKLDPNYLPTVITLRGINRFPQFLFSYSHNSMAIAALMRAVNS